MDEKPPENTVSEKAAGEWRFQLNIMGFTLLLFAAGYIGKHLASLLPMTNVAQGLSHYLGEVALRAVAVVFALSRAFGSTPHHRHRVVWLEGTTLVFYLGLGAAVLNIILLSISVVYGMLK